MFLDVCVSRGIVSDEGIAIVGLVVRKRTHAICCKDDHIVKYARAQITRDTRHSDNLHIHNHDQEMMGDIRPITASHK